MDEQLQLIKSRLDNISIRITDVWLTDRIKYFLKQNSDLSQQTLFEMVCKEWLLADLRTIGIPCLPSTLDDIDVLDGRFVLQLQSIQDISVSPGDQLVQMLSQASNAMGNLLREPVNGPRLLKLELTDGSCFITALEYRFIKGLNLSLAPGTKVVLQGPVKASCGILFLEEKNIFVIGGKVEGLLERNSAISVLLKTLGLLQ